jgi:hypothetical protein
MDQISGRNFVIRFFPKYLSIGQKTSKTVIALEGKLISAYPFRRFLLSLGPTYGQDITSKAIYKLVNLSRELNAYLIKNPQFIFLRYQYFVGPKIFGLSIKTLPIVFFRRERNLPIGLKILVTALTRSNAFL